MQIFRIFLIMVLCDATQRSVSFCIFGDPTERGKVQKLYQQISDESKDLTRFPLKIQICPVTCEIWRNFSAFFLSSINYRHSFWSVFFQNQIWVLDQIHLVGTKYTHKKHLIIGPLSKFITQAIKINTTYEWTKNSNYVKPKSPPQLLRRRFWFNVV